MLERCTGARTTFERPMEELMAQEQCGSKNGLSFVCHKVRDPAFTPIRWSFDERARRARMEIPGLLQHRRDPV